MFERSMRFVVRYGVVGVINTLAGNLIFAAIWNAVGSWLGYMGSSVLSFILSVVLSFWMQMHLVFSVRDAQATRLGRYVIVQVANLAVFLLALAVMRQATALGPYVIYFLGSVLVIALGFVANLKWVFAGREDVDVGH